MPHARRSELMRLNQPPEWADAISSVPPSRNRHRIASVASIAGVECCQGQVEVLPRLVDSTGIDPTWWLTPQNNSGDTHPFGGHHAYARPLHGGWRKNPAGHWQSTTEDDRQWEVVCEECGDTDGPIELQTAKVRSLRGPYPTKHQAEHEAKMHRKGKV